jgi:hypothetical protein
MCINARARLYKKNFVFKNIARPASHTGGAIALELGRASEVVLGLLVLLLFLCPGRKPPFLAVKRPVRPDKSAIKPRFTMGNAKGA